MRTIGLTLSILIATLYIAQAQVSPMVTIKGGEYIPLYGSDSAKVKVASIKMDVYPVTNLQFLNFVKENPKWRRSNVKGLFADKNYLSTWQSDTILGVNLKKDTPITEVSWFAAKNYCECQNKRLPTIDEWEYAAMADEELPDARQKKHTISLF